jgi:hypothetical protein
LRPCPSLVPQAGVAVLVMAPLPVIGAIGECRCLAAVVRLALACGMVNRSPYLESHRDSSSTVPVRLALWET